MVEEKYDGYKLKTMLYEGARALSHSKSSIDALNVFPVPDGDTGTNMDLTLQAACKEIEKLTSNDLREISNAFATGSLMGARGNSGVILSQLIRGFSKAFEKRQVFDAYVFAEGLVNGVNTAYKSVLKPVEGTMLTVAKDSALGAQKYLKKTKTPSLEEILKEVIKSGEKSLEETPEKLKVLKEAGVVDAGGMGLVVIYKGFLNGMEKTFMEAKSDLAKSNVLDANQRDTSSIEGSKGSGYKYCTELIVKGENLDEDSLKSELMPLGDSLLVVGSKDLIKIHIHTDRPGLVLDRCCNVGELSDVKIDNMKEQHAEFINKDKSSSQEVNLKAKDIIEVVSIANGQGFKDIFESMGVSKVIFGGQSMNPSTEDVFNAVEDISANKVIILPNNKNIIMSCKQVKDLTQKEVQVVETTTVPQGFAALLEFDPEADDIDKEKEKMEDNKEDVVTAQITYAIRGTIVNGIQVDEGSIIGVVEDEIIYSGKNIDEVVCQTLYEAVDKDKEIISIFAGEDVTEEESKSLKEKVSEKFEDLEIELYKGGQPLYYYIFSIE